MNPQGGIVGIITARAGSKRLPGKNYRLLCGKPLIAWTIEAALASKALDQIVVTSDDSRILHIAKDYNVNIVERDAELSSDDATSIDAVIDTLDRIEQRGTMPQAAMLLQPTSPLRDAEDIRAAIAYFNKHPNDALVSMCETECPSQWIAEVDEHDTIQCFDPTRPGSKSQYLRLNGAIYLVATAHARKNKSFYTDVTRVYRMSREASLDIDTEEDFDACRRILAGRLGEHSS